MNGNGKRPRRGIVRTFVATAVIGLFMALSASSASAVTIGLVWNGDYGAAASEMDQVQNSGATVFRMPIDETRCSDTAGWGACDVIFQAAWEHGITIQPYLVRANSEGTRFLTSAQEPQWKEWGSWSRKVIEHYGINGSFWTSKSNPKPVTAWEVWNEENLAKNNPGGTSVQPQNYGRFLKYTAEKLQAGSIAKTGHGTEVVFGGLYMPAGEYYNSFLETSSAISGVPGSYQAVGIHPYSFDYGVTQMAERVNDVRYGLDHHVSGGSGKPLWITEVGWPVGGTGAPLVSEAQQASLLTESLNWIKANAGNYNIPLVDWYNIRDLGGQSTWSYFCGLRKADGSYRPSWSAFQAEAGVPTPAPPVRVAYADALQANSTSVWERPSGGGWSQTFLWGHEIAAGSSPETLEYGGTKHVFYVDAQDNNTISTWYWNSTTGWQQEFLYGHSVAKGTSPSGVVINGTPHLYFVDATNNNSITEWTWTSSSGWQQNFLYGHPVMEGSSPSAMVNNGLPLVFFADAADNNTITQWSWTPSAGWQQMFFYGHSVTKGSSPSALNYLGNPEVFYSDATDNNSMSIWGWNSLEGWTQVFLYGHALTAGSSPSSILWEGHQEVFFSDANNNNSMTMWYGNFGWTQTFLYGHQIAAGSSPSATMEGTTPHVYFVDALDNNSITDWNWSPGAGWQQGFLYGHAVTTGSSPSAF